MIYSQNKENRGSNQMHQSVKKSLKRVIRSRKSKEGERINFCCCKDSIHRKVLIYKMKNETLCNAQNVVTIIWSKGHGTNLEKYCNLNNLTMNIINLQVLIYQSMVNLHILLRHMVTDGENGTILWDQ